MAAEFLYPARGNFSTENDNRMINIFDQLFLEYTSVWPSLNLTLYCVLIPETSRLYSAMTYADENPIAGSGIYYFGTLYSLYVDEYVTSYPTYCKFRLTKYGDNDDSVDGEHFWITSNAASSTTFSPTVTSTTLASTGTGTTTQTTDTVTILSNSASSLVATETQAATETSASASSKSSGLSAGAAAGIGAGVGLAVVVLAAAMLFMFFRRRKAGKAATQDVSPENPPRYAAKSEDAAKPEYSSQHQQQDPQEMEAISPAELDNGQSFPVVRHELSG